MSSPSHLTPSQLKLALKREAQRLGFLALGISRAEALDEEAERLRDWLNQGRHGTMAWMEGYYEKRVDPCLLVPGAKSVISVLENYYQPEAHSDAERVGKISRYAWGDDYHIVMRRRLESLLSWLDSEVGGAGGRVFVDSAPVMDKAWAARAGLGWIGKHTNLINQQVGSWFFIGELIVNTELEPDSPVPDLCGSCTRCIDACPTDAIVAPYELDASRCISYLTIEHRQDDIPVDLRRRTDDWIFGCDVCQDVCPWNKFAEPSAVSEYRPRPDTLDTPLLAWGGLSEDAFRERFKGSPVKRAKWSGFQRNIRMALENAETHPTPTAAAASAIDPSTPVNSKPGEAGLGK